MREKDIEAYFRRKIKQLGGLALKFESPGFTGVPDRIVFMKKVVPFLVELKAPGKKLRPRQDYVRRQLIELDVKVFDCDTREKIDLLIGTLSSPLKKQKRDGI